MAVFRRGSGVEVKFHDGWYSVAPRCRHGPMLLFEKYISGRLDGRRFYACSACRSRKDCNAFMWEDDFERSRKKKEVVFIGDKDPPKQGRKINKQTILALNPSERFFCTDCQMVISGDNKRDSSHPCHTHNLKEGVSDDEMSHPSLTLLTPLNQDKSNAQYLLDEKSLQFLLNMLKRLRYTHVVCIGMPTLHEEIQYKFAKMEKQRNGASKHQIMDSILLDIDTRYEQFTDPDRFCRFNMFNHHFFDEGLERFQNFICKAGQKTRMCFVLDPPFGGLVDAVAKTLMWLTTRAQDTVPRGDSLEIFPTFWIFPYFMERRIKEKNLQLCMLDYQVNYQNHAKFKKKSTSTRISPVRIFTNIEEKLIPLPKNEGYRFCHKCVRHVSTLNKHCDLCDLCPSKDGKTWVHCSKCNVCVKPGHVHCDNCGRCELRSHSCKDADAYQLGCHLCGQVTHKRRDCPMTAPRKRICPPSDGKETGKVLNKKAKQNGAAHPKEVVDDGIKACSHRNFVFHARSSHCKRYAYKHK